MSRALIVVDVQNDFCEGGSLAVAGGIQVARDISRYLQDHGSEYDLVLATRDWHDPGSDNAGHISSEPDFVDSWPAHCIAGTRGAEYRPELWPDGARYPHDQVAKGQGVPAYSGFEGTNAQGQGLGDILQQAGIVEVDVAGIALDYCVRATAVDAKRAGYTTRVLKDLTAAIRDDGSADALLQDEGVIVVESSGQNGIDRQDA